MSHFSGEIPFISLFSWARRAVICTQGEAPCVCVRAYFLFLFFYIISIYTIIIIIIFYLFFIISIYITINPTKLCVCVCFCVLPPQIFALSMFFVSRFLGREGQRLHLRGRHQGLNPGPHLPFPRLGGHPSSPVSWVVRATVCTQGKATLHLPFHGQGRPPYAPKAEAPRIEPMISSPIYQARRPPFISRFMGRGLGGTLYILGFSLHKRRN